jgi:hypothetical protein
LPKKYSLFVLDATTGFIANMAGLVVADNALPRICTDAKAPLALDAPCLPNMAVQMSRAAPLNPQRMVFF